MNTSVYQASPIKRARATKAGVLARRNALHQIVSDMRPMTVRQVFYQATVRGLIEKTEAGYNKVQHDLVLMRRAGVLPYGWLADNTRWQRKPNTHRSIYDALKETARFYRRDLWADAESYVEVWLEKDALAGVVMPVTELNDVPLMVSRGYASLSFLHSAASYISEIEKPTYIYHLGDFDPSGQDAARAIEQALREMAPDAEIHFKRLAVTVDQVDRWDLPTRPTKASDTRSAKFGSEISVELDAIAPDQLRALVADAITLHLPQHELDVLMEAEKSEREYFLDLVRDFNAGGAL